MEKTFKSSNFSYACQLFCFKPYKANEGVVEASEEM